MKVMRDKAGISLIFVLAAMWLLMALGVSAITAAGMNVGAGVAQRDRNQLELYASSMERTVKAAFDGAADKNGGNTVVYNINDDADTLGRLILREAFNKSFFADDSSGFIAPPESGDEMQYEYTLDTDIFSFTPVITVDSEDIEAVYHIEINGEVCFKTYPYKRYKKIYDKYVMAGEEYATPLTAMIAANEIVVTQTTEYPAPGGEHLSKTTETTYRYEGGYLVELWEPDGPDLEYRDVLSVDNILIRDPDKWKVIKHETISRQSP